MNQQSHPTVSSYDLILQSYPTVSSYLIPYSNPAVASYSLILHSTRAVLDLGPYDDPSFKRPKVSVIVAEGKYGCVAVAELLLTWSLLMLFSE